MSIPSGSSPGPIALQHDESEALWFLGVLTIIKAGGNPGIPT